MSTKLPVKSARQKHHRKPSSPNNITVPEQRISFQQRLNPVYLEEEAKVQKLIDSRHGTVNEKTQSDLEVLFFTDGLSTKDLNEDRAGSVSSFKSLQSTGEFPEQQTSTNYLDSIVQIDEEKLFDRVKLNINYDPELLFRPSTEKPSMPNVQSTNGLALSSQGIHETALPPMTLTNKHLLYNRLLEENKFHLFNPNGELIGLKDQRPEQRQLLTHAFTTTNEFPVKFTLIDEDQLHAQKQLEDSNVLVIKVGRLQFQHHYLFSEEIFLAKTIEQAFKEYSQSQKSVTIEKLLQRITFLRNSKSPTTKPTTEPDEIKPLLTELLDLRSQYHAEKKRQFERIRGILEDYKTLKSLRSAQQFNATTLKLIISVDGTLANEHRRKELEDFFEEEVEDSFELQNLEYQDKRKDRRQSRKSLTAEELDNLPAMPQKPSLDKIRTTLRKKYKEAHLDQHQDEVRIQMGHLATTGTSSLMEKKRSSSVSAVKFHLRILCNNEIIGVLNAKPMTEDFLIDFNSCLSIRLISRLPDQIRIDVIEERPLKPKMKVSKIFIPVPRLQTNIEATDYNSLQFQSPKNIQGDDIGIGAGQFCIRKNQQQMIRGHLAVKIGWQNVNLDLSIPEKRLAHSSIEKGETDSQFDPMHPDGGECPDRRSLHENSNEDEDQDQEGDNQESGDFFFLEDELTFCSEEEFKSNKRNKILMERSKKNLKFKDLKLVPHERQLDGMVNESSMKLIDETLGMDPIDLQRFKGKKYLGEVYGTISSYCKSLNEECEENQLLMDNMPTLASISAAFFQLFGPNRPLKPVRRRQGSHRLSSLNVDVRQFKVSLNIVRAFGIPQRTDEVQVNPRKSSNMSSASPNTNGYRPINIRPFVTASYKEVSMRTSTGDGSNPTWNEQMTIPLNLKSWADMKGYLVIQLFDEYVDDVLEDDRNRLTDIYQRISSRFIGDLRIPLTDLYFSQRIEGTFAMHSPPLLGYSKAMLKTPPPQGQQGPSLSFTTTPTSNLVPDLKGSIYISLLINLEPFFEHSFFTTKHLTCTESDQLKNTVGSWMYDFQTEFPNRRMDPFVTLLNGKRTFIINLLGSTSIPFSNDTGRDEDKEQQESFLRRYVSLIPTLQTIDSCVEVSGVWLLHDQVFKTLRCSLKDLAVILTNFYLSIGLEAWLMIGESQLRVNSCFVLLKLSETDYFIVDPVSGSKYQHTDTYCPLSSVHYLINDKNIWGNIQEESKVFMTRYDVKISSDWRSMFKRTQEISRGFLQDSNYTFKASYDIRNIHAVIESKLTKKIGQWRGHRKTVWNRLVRDNLRRILVELEKDAAESGESAIERDHLEKLNFLHNNYKISGCPLNMSYINLSHVVERVKATGIHLNTDPRAEFGLSVYVHPYPNFIISVWVFLIALVPK